MRKRLPLAIDTAQVGSDGWPTSIFAAMKKWHLSLATSGFNPRTDLWTYDTFATLIKIMRHYGWMTAAMDNLEHRLASAKMRGLSVEQFLGESQSRDEIIEAERANFQLAAEIQKVKQQAQPVRRQRRAVNYGGDE